MVIAGTRAKHVWAFKPRFRKGAFGWRSQPALKRVNEALAEIKRVAKKDPVLGAEGAVIFLERVAPALENIDGSSGAIGSAVNRAIAELSAIIAAAPADAATRDDWLERLYEAHANDERPFIERLADHWGELCSSRETASAWANRLIGITTKALSPDPNMRGHFHGTTMCLTALLRAERYAEIIALLEHTQFWDDKRYAVIAMAKLGQNDEAIELAESQRGPWTPSWDVDRICEEILLSLGRVDEAFERYGCSANVASTYVAWFKNVLKKYPHKTAGEVLARLVAATPGEEGKWFAAAKDARLFRRSARAREADAVRSQDARARGARLRGDPAGVCDGGRRRRARLARAGLRV